MTETYFQPLKTLSASIKLIFTDRQWPLKLGIGGLLLISGIGLVFPYGLLIEHLDNSRRGFRVPLPPWRQWGDKAVLGTLALIFDFTYFVLPLICMILLIFCAIFPLLFQNNVPVFGTWIAVGGLVGVWLWSFMLSLSPISKVYFSHDGELESHLGRKALSRSLNSLVRAIYFKARLVTIPLYLPAIIIGWIIWNTIQSTQSSALVVAGLCWLLGCSLFWAWLIVGQVYLHAVEQAEERIIDERLAARQQNIA